MAKQKQKSKTKAGAVVQTYRQSSHPFSAIDRYQPLSRPEFAVYDAIREAVPVVGAAIDKIIRLVGGFKVECSTERVEKELAEFLKTVPTGKYTSGINSFLGAFTDSLLMYGTAVGEMVMTGDGQIAGLYNASLKDIELDTSGNPFECTVAVKEPGGKPVPVKHPERVLLAAANPTADRPEGRSMLDGMPFVTSILLKIFESIGTNFDRIGNLRYAVTYRPASEGEADLGEERAGQIAAEWSAAMSDKDGVRDFVAIGDVDIKVIGADNQSLDCEVPVRQMLEQIIAKTAIPPSMLGLSWSTTERMSSEQADVLIGELGYYREVLSPSVNKIIRSWLNNKGYTDDYRVVWNDITLKDEVEQAKARLLRAQAEKIEKSEVEIND